MNIKSYCGNCQALYTDTRKEYFCCECSTLVCEKCIKEINKTISRLTGENAIICDECLIENEEYKEF